jgi:serine/threonine protein kinase
MEPAESVLRAGYKLDRYELLCPIASGGMATVWLARLRGKRGFEKLFAIKTIRTELVDDARFQEMFLDEARIASGIQHPNVTQILDLGDQEDVLFIVMEWVDGDSLAKIRKVLAKRGAKLPLGVVLRVIADACAGLHAAHEMRDDNGEPLEIVHRDVSPQNILVSTGGAVKVIDFGIAKAQNRKQGETRTGVVKGKIQYMAPEQVKKGRTVDRRADVWALGVCLQELVTGSLPYEGDDDVEVIRKLMSDEPPAPVRGLPAPIAYVMERAMAFEAADRFPTAAAMERALESAMKELGESATDDDVAEFLRAELPDLGRKRKDVVGKAIEEARERATGSGAGEPGGWRAAGESGSRVAAARHAESASDVAFAKTEVGARDGVGRGRAASGDEAMSEREPTFALRKRKDLSPDSGLRTAPPSPARPRAQDDDEPIRIPKKSLAWLWVMLLLIGGGAGAAYRWPAEARHLVATLGLGGETSSPPAASADGASLPPIAASSPRVAAAPSSSAAAAGGPAVAPSAGSPVASALGAPSSTAPASPSAGAERGPLEPAAGVHPRLSIWTSPAGAPAALPVAPPAERLAAPPAAATASSAPPSPAPSEPSPPVSPPGASAAAPSPSGGEDPNNPYAN